MIQSFSNNIYDELSGYDLKNEYKRTKTEWAHYRFMLDKGMIKNDVQTQNFIEKLS